MQKSLQEIEDFYIQRGYSGDKFRQALKEDAQYQKPLVTKKSKLQKKFTVSKEEEKIYVLSTDNDYDILGKCKILENKSLSTCDLDMVKLIKSQLQDDWRKPLTEKINVIFKKYR